MLRPNKKQFCLRRNVEKGNAKCIFFLKFGKMLMQNAFFLFSLHFWPTFPPPIFCRFETLSFFWKLKKKSSGEQVSLKPKKEKKMQWKVNSKSNAHDLLRQTCFFIWPLKSEWDLFVFMLPFIRRLVWTEMSQFI